MSDRTPARAARRSFSRARIVPNSLLQVPTSFSAVRSSDASVFARSESSRLVVSMVRTTSRSQRAMVRTMVNCVTRFAQIRGAEHGVHRARVLVLVQGHGPGGQGGAGQAELLVRETLEPAIVLDLPADRLQRPGRARVASDGGADLGVERRYLGGELAGLGPVLLEPPRTRARRRGDHPEHACRHAQSEQGGQRQTTYRMAVVQYASSRGERTTARFWSRPHGCQAQRDRVRSKPSTRRTTAQAQDLPG